MLHGLKHKFDLYFHSIADTTNQLINSPKLAPVVAPALVGFGIVDINNALQTLSVAVGILVGGVSLWVMIEKFIHEKNKRKEEAAIRRLEYKNLQLKISALEGHIKRPQ